MPLGHSTVLNGPITQKLVAAAPWIASCETSALAGYLEQAASDLRALVASQELASQLHQFLEDAHAGRAVPIEDGKPGEIVLFRNASTFISLANYDEPAKYLHTHPVRGVFCVLRGSPFELRTFRLPHYWDPLDPSAGSKLTPLDVRRVQIGDVIAIDGMSEVAWFGYESSVVVAKYIVSIDTLQNWAFDPHTLELTDPECADSRLDALIHTISLLGAIRSKSSLDSLQAASRHDAYFVRLAAIQATAAISKSSAFGLLEAALNDKHRLVRMAAERALAQLQPGETHGTHFER